jgi:hypothetical protein
MTSICAGKFFGCEPPLNITQSATASSKMSEIQLAPAALAGYSADTAIGLDLRPNAMFVAAIRNGRQNKRPR